MTTIENLYEAAYRAYSNISFDPEKRAAQTVKDYEEELDSDLESMPECERGRYADGYKKHLFAWLSAMSRTVSVMIIGPANFPVARNQKSLNAEHSRLCEFIEWREKAIKSIKKRIEENKPESQKKSETWERLEKNILESAVVIHGINKGTERGYNKALFVSSIYQKVEVYAKKGDTYTVSKAIECIRHFNEVMSVVITERHKFFNLLDAAENVKMAMEEKESAESEETVINGVRVVKNQQADRIQLFFDGKPATDMISKLKHAAFKWSPSNGCWQRQLTQNAIHATNRVLAI